MIPIWAFLLIKSMQTGVGGPLGAWRCMQETQGIHSLDQSQSASQGYRFPSSLGARAGGNTEPSQGCGCASFSVPCLHGSLPYFLFYLFYCCLTLPSLFMHHLGFCPRQRLMFPDDHPVVVDDMNKRLEKMHQ